MATKLKKIVMIPKTFVDNFVNFNNFERSDNFKNIKTMKKKYLWMMAAILVCGAMTVSISLSSCENANAQEDMPLAVQHP